MDSRVFSSHRGKRIDNDPDYQRLMRYYKRAERLEAEEADAYNRGDIAALNIARGLLANTRGQIRELQEIVGYDGE